MSINDPPNQNDDVGFHFAAKKERWFVPVVALIFGSLTAVCLFLPNATAMTAIFGGGGLLAVLLALNDQSKTKYRSVSFDGNTLRVQDSKKQIRETDIDDVLKAEVGTDNLLIRLRHGPYWDVGFGWISEDAQEKIAVLINDEISRRKA